MGDGGVGVGVVCTGGMWYECRCGRNEGVSRESVEFEFNYGTV